MQCVFCFSQPRPLIKVPPHGQRYQKLSLSATGRNSDQDRRISPSWRYCWLHISLAPILWKSNFLCLALTISISCASPLSSYWPWFYCCTLTQNLTQDEKLTQPRAQKFRLSWIWRNLRSQLLHRTAPRMPDPDSIVQTNCAARKNTTQVAGIVITALLIYYSKGKHALIDVFLHDSLKVVNSTDWTTRTNLLLTHQCHPQINLGLCFSSPVLTWVWPQICFTAANALCCTQF